MGSHDDREHLPGNAPDWTETNRLDLVSSDGLTGLSLELSVQSEVGGGAAFLAVVLERGMLPVVIADLEVAAPRTGMEIRTSGLWAEFVRETPMEHWSYGLEAFALAIDDPEELMGRGMGDRVPLGWELEFEASALAEPLVGPVSGYTQRGFGHGLLLSKEGALAIEGHAMRSHWWGVEQPSSLSLVLPEADAEPASGGLASIETGSEQNPWVLLPGLNGTWQIELAHDGMHSRAHDRSESEGGTGAAVALQPSREGES